MLPPQAARPSANAAAETVMQAARTRLLEVMLIVLPPRYGRARCPDLLFALRECANAVNDGGLADRLFDLGYARLLLRG